jgi:hypothetical protein
MVLIFGPSSTDSQFDPSPTYYIHRGYHFGQQCGIPERVAGDQLPETDSRSDPQQRRNEDKTFKKVLFPIGFKDGSSL